MLVTWKRHFLYDLIGKIETKRLYNAETKGIKTKTNLNSVHKSNGNC